MTQAPQSPEPPHRREVSDDRDPLNPPAEAATAPEPADGAEIGSLIGGVFGLVFLIVNSAGFSTVGRIGVIVLGIAAFAGILVLAFRSLGRRRGQPRPAGAKPFSRSYWIIVAVEALALFGGAKLLSGLGYPELGVAWVAVVVGTHFYALGYVFRLGRFHVLATVVTLLGVAGFIAFLASAPAFIPVLAGVIPGFVLLAFALWALAPAASAPAPGNAHPA
ncbi:hypothetical protein [Brevibacterium casei]|uniref:Uncharacterized protein n=1 Tax=Brevibacterium casei TaxID=33889 RepID=A0A7T4A0I6_9MICO|nr:hypothetical protein [Brevibacterium casei]QQB15089.1 hypothetical protein I6H47_03760 [Brevibacterium casei]